MDIRIVCDASYLSSLRITGYAGIITEVLGDKEISNQTYVGSTAEQVDSVEAELSGIFAGISYISKMVDYTNKIVDNIQIYCDCEAALNIINNSQKTTKPEHQKIKNNVDDIVSHYSWQEKVHFHHVKAHVNKLYASPVEIVNTKVDSLARGVRNKLIEDRTTCSPTSPYISLIIPPSFEEEKLNQVIPLFYYAKENSMQIRVLIDNMGESSSSIKDVARRLQEESGADINNFTTEFTKLTDVNTPFDKTLLRQFLKSVGMQSNVEIEDNQTTSFALSAVRLLSGQVTNPPHLDEQFTHTTLQPLSSILVDLTYPSIRNEHWSKNTKGWALALCGATDCPIFDSPEKAISFIKNIGHKSNRLFNLEKQPSSLIKLDAHTKTNIQRLIKLTPFENNLRKMVDTYFQLSSKQLVTKVFDLLDEYNYSDDSLFRDSVNRFCLLSSKAKPEIFSNRLTRHINKMHIPKEPTNEASIDIIVDDKFTPPTISFVEESADIKSPRLGRISN